MSLYPIVISNYPFSVAGSGNKDGKGSKDNNSPSGPYAGKLQLIISLRIIIFQI